MNDDITIDDLFDRRQSFPDSDAQDRLARLVGLDDAQSRLRKLLATMVHPAGVRAWAKKHHNGAGLLLTYVEGRPPLAILAGDVGTGKTELAETVGDSVARAEGVPITLYPLSLATRGTGKVGQMTTLLSSAFELTLDAAMKLKRTGGDSAGGVILLVDEADALAQSREATQMHHEDRAGVNAFIRGVDLLAQRRVPVAVILCTNRLGALDPAVRRRAAELFVFRRPDSAQRLKVLDGPLSELGFSAKEIGELVKLTGASSNSGTGFTYSDLTQRLLPGIAMDAYPDHSVSFPRALALLKAMKPTPSFKESD